MLLRRLRKVCRWSDTLSSVSSQMLPSPPIRTGQRNIGFGGSICRKCAVPLSVPSGGKTSTMTEDEPALVDINVLVYSASRSALQHQASRALLESEIRLCVAPQVLAEFYAVVTNPRRVTVPFNPSEARAFVDELISRMEILPVPSAVVRRWSELAEPISSHGSQGV